MGQSKQMLHLNLFIMGTGHHEAAWRHASSEPADVTGVGHYARLLRTAERGKFDSLFLADTYHMSPTIRFKVLQGLEPFTLLSALAMATSRIGLIGTASTTYNEPYHVARSFASLDHISRGRAGWNIVTSTSDMSALNFADARLPEHTERYKRAEEFFDVVLALWDSWHDDAFLADQRSGVFADTDNIAELRHRGKYFAVKGAMNISRSPQGHPVLVQAGASDSGRAFAAKAAEVVFTAQNTMLGGKAFYADLKGQLARYGRSRDSMKVLPGFCAIVGDTPREAAEKEQELHRLTQPEYGLQRLSNLFGTDMSGYPLDGPVPFNDLPDTEQINGHRGRHQLVLDMARSENLTLRQVILRTASSRGHYSFAGTPAQIADDMQRWLEGGAADGFNLMPPLLPGSLDEFVDKVVPELQSRGLFRADYSGETLREHYGLDRPACREQRA